MRADLKGLWIYDLEGAPVDEPSDPTHFGSHVQAFIGLEGDSQADSFDFVVCTPTWLTENFHDVRLTREDCEASNVLFGRHLVLMERWDYVELWSVIAAFAAGITGPEWRTVANQVGRWIQWEFDYKFDEHLEAVGGLPPLSAADPD